MKKIFTFSFTLLLVLITGQAAFAQIGVRTSTDDVEYRYYLRVTVPGVPSVTTGNIKYYAALPAAGEDILTIQNDKGTKAKFIFKESDTDGYYDIYVTNSSESGNAAVYRGATMEDSAYPLTISTTGTPTPFSLVPTVTSNGPMANMYGLWITPAENGSTYNTWAKNSTNHLLNRNDSKRQWAVWVLEAAEPAPIAFSSSSTLATYSTPIAAQIPVGVKAYIATGTTENNDVTTLTLEEITDSVIPAGVGVLLENTGNLTEAQYPTEVSSTNTYESNLFSPTTLASTSAPSYTSVETISESATGSITIAADGDNNTTYVLGNPTGGNGVGFYELSSTNRTIAAYKAYLKGPKKTSEDNTAVKLLFPDGTTGILNIDGTATKNMPIYDLTGRCVKKLVKGSLYIQNGKKFIAQ